MQSTREIASEYRLRHWAQIIANQKGSGLNIKDYCEREGFNQNRYFYWQRKLRQTLCDAPPAAVGGQIAPEGWTAVEASETMSGVVHIEIGPYRVIVDERTDERLLAKVCRVLSRSC